MSEVVVRPEQSFWKRTFNYDSMRNFLAGLNVAGRDKAAGQQFILDVMDPGQLEKAYRGDWLARKIVDIPAFDSCRAWRTWQAEQDQIEKLEDAERKFGMQRKLMDAMVKARLYGGAAMVMGIKGQDFKEELDIDKVKEGDLVFVHTVSRWMISPGPLVMDITSPWFGEPEYYQRSNTPVSPQVGGVQPLEAGPFGKEAGGQLMIHPSRVVRIIGNDYPNMEMSPDAWGDSVLQTVSDAIKDAGLVSSSLAALVAKANVDIIKVPGLTQMMSTDKGTNKLVERFAGANAAKSIVNALLIDSAEEWDQLQVTFAGMPQVFQMYLGVAAGAADIPATRLLGKSPDGQNSTGDSDLRNYYDKLQAEQKVKVTPAISRLDEVLIRSVFGNRPKDIHYDWAPLWQMDDDQKSKIWLAKSQAYKIEVDTGLISPDALRVARENQLVEDGVYPGLDAALDDAEAQAGEDVPEEAIPPHPAIREKNAAREEAMARFQQTQQQQTQQHKERLAVQKKQPMFGKPGGGSPFGKPNGKSNGAANGNGAAKDALADDLVGGGQSELGFEVPFGGRRRKRGRPFDEDEPPVVRIKYPVEDWHPDQPRVPAGSPEGGQWGGGGGSRAETLNEQVGKAESLLKSHLAQGGGPVGFESAEPAAAQLLKETHGSMKAAAIAVGSPHSQHGAPNLPSKIEGDDLDHAPSVAQISAKVEAHIKEMGWTEPLSPFHMGQQKYKAAIQIGSNYASATWATTAEEDEALAKVYGSTEKAWGDLVAHEKVWGGPPSPGPVPEAAWKTAAQAHGISPANASLLAKLQDYAKKGIVYNDVISLLSEQEQATLTTSGYGSVAVAYSAAVAGYPAHVDPQPPNHGAFEHKALGEHKHFKAAASLEEHQQRVKSWVAAKALRNHTYRWQTKKLIEEGKAFAAKNPQIVSDFAAAQKALKIKIGESFAREAGAMQIKGDPKHQASAMLSKAMNLTGEISIDKMIALGWLPSAEKIQAFNNPTTGAATLPPITSTGSPAEKAEAELKFSAEHDQNTDALLNVLTLAENSALKDKYGGIAAALTSAKAKVAMAKLDEKKAADEWAAKQAADLKATTAAIEKTGATPAEIEKAKKTSPYYPAPASPEAQALAQGWNEKYSGKQLTDPAALAQKVVDYKIVAAQISALATKEQSAAKAAAEVAAAKAKAEYAKTHAAEIAAAAAAKAKKDAETAEHMKEVALFVSELGCSPNDGEAVDALLHLSGKSAGTLVAEFKQAKDSGDWKGMPISPFEYGMIQSYVGSGYHTVNDALRNGFWNMQTQVFAAAIQNALKKLPAYDKTVYRGITINSGEQQAYAVGNVVPWKAFSSCGKSSHFGGNTQFTITPNGGFRDLGKMNPGECGGEVLGVAGALMKVTKVEGKPGGGTMKVWVEELKF